MKSFWKKLYHIKNIVNIFIVMAMLSGCASKGNASTASEPISEYQNSVESQKESTSVDEQEEETDEVKMWAASGEAVVSEEAVSDVVDLLGKIKESASKELCEELYEKQTTVESIPNIIKKWNRTEVHSSHSAILDITAADNKGFDFTLEAQYYFHTGNVVGRAYFVAEDCAVYRLDEMDTFHLSEEEYEYVVFAFNNDGINVYASGSSAKLGLGMNVYVWGAYIAGEPVYTNAGILEKTYTEAQLQFAKEQLPSDYYDNFIFATQFGGVNTSEEDGIKTVETFVPTASQYSYAVKIKDEVITSILFGDETEFHFE